MKNCYSDNDFSQEILSGTTILSCLFKNGVLMASDSRRSDPNSNMVINRFTNKICKINDHVIFAGSGTVADIQAATDYVFEAIYLEENNTGKSFDLMKIAAKFRQFCFENRNTINVSLIVSGSFLDSKDQTKISCFHITAGGMMVGEDFAITGSGSKYISGLVKNEYKKDMEENACIELACKALYQAMSHDASSGGVIHIAVLKNDGIERSIRTTDRKGNIKILK